MLKFISFKFRITQFIFCLFFMLSLIGCSKKIGYGVVNWSIPEYHLFAGDIIPVYVRSNIEHVYIVGLNEKTDVRLEIPLWQLSFFESKKAALEFKEKLSEQRHIYATVKLDGLPIRKEPDNSSGQIYRLRMGQTVKVLWHGDGVPVLKKGTPLDGQWYTVLTNDGVKGWCFSYNLIVYDERNAELTSAGETDSIQDSNLEAVLNSSWYPEYYKKMLHARQVKLEKVSLTFGFFPGAGSGIARIALDDIKLSFPYKKILKIENRYQFEGTNLSMQINSPDSITLEFSDAKGKSRIENFVTLTVTPEDIINAETKRRENQIDEIVNISQDFFSANFGTLKIIKGGKFVWSGYNVITPSIIPAGAGSSGDIYIKYFLSTKLIQDYDGVLNFKFEKNAEPIVFLYNISSLGLRLEVVDKENIDDFVVTKRNLNPVILFFAVK